MGRQCHLNTLAVVTYISETKRNFLALGCSRNFRTSEMCKRSGKAAVCRSMHLFKDWNPCRTRRLQYLPIFCGDHWRSGLRRKLLALQHHRQIENKADSCSTTFFLEASLSSWSCKNTFLEASASLGASSLHRLALTMACGCAYHGRLILFLLAL